MKMQAFCQMGSGLPCVESVRLTVYVTVSARIHYGYATAAPDNIRISSFGRSKPRFLELSARVQPLIILKIFHTFSWKIVYTTSEKSWKIV